MSEESMPARDMQKMYFEYEVDDEHYEVESMWVRPCHGSVYELENIPFYVKGLAYGDKVEGKPDLEGRLEFVRVVESGHHSTLRVVVFDESRKQDVCELFGKLGCDFETSGIDSLIAIDVPPEVSWSEVTALLIKLAGEGTLDWQEAAISRHHVP